MNISKAFAGLALAAACVAAATPALAIPTYYSHKIYYTDATKTVWAGELILDCFNHHSYEGTITPYFIEVERYLCSTGEPAL
jgi:hypothetical protein